MNYLEKSLFQMHNNVELLIEYNVFFEKSNSFCCFALDDNEELNELKSILEKIKSIDNTANIYCCTYGVNNNDAIYIYSDDIWIDTILSINELKALFMKYDTIHNPLRGVVPNDILGLSEEELQKNNIEYIVSSSGNIKNYNEIKTVLNGKSIKRMLWD